MNLKSSPSNDGAVFLSKRDSWLELPLIAAAIFPFLIAAFVGFQAARGVAPWEAAVIVTAIVVVIGPLIVWLPWSIWRNTSYTFTATTLIVKSGPFRWTVPLEQIREVVPSRSLLAAPALSRDRLWVRTGSFATSMLLSPADKPAFLAALRDREPALRPDGARLVRLSAPRAALPVPS
jgi:PH (Pleckstrin Homology) domain-containing protein